jgi:hypothetical protein
MDPDSGLPAADFPWAALEAARGLPAAAEALTALARDHGEEAARWAVGQWQLRRRGREKFARAEEMLFDADGLEMATHESVAAWRADLFPEGCEALDATCGIGGDLIALAGRCRATGVDLDERRLAMAGHNLRIHGREARLSPGDAGRALARADWALLDPQRRGGGRRLEPAELHPSPWVLKDRLSGMRLAAIKLSPMTPDPLLEELGPGIRFISFRGECREALVLTGREAPKGRSAILLPERIEWRAAADPPVVHEPDRFMFDADPAIVRAGALGNWSLSALATSRGWLTGRAHQSGPWKAYETLWKGGFRPKAIQSELMRLEARISIVKTRGAPHDPAIVRRRFRPEGPREVALMLYRDGPRIGAILAEPI